MDFLRDALDLQALVLLLILFLAASAFSRMLSADNPIESWHFVASRDADGKQWGDPKKLAIMIGIFASTLFVGYVFWSVKIYDFWVFAIFVIWLIFISAIDVFSAWARSFVDRRFGQAQSQKIAK